jgi:hypothetical protein
VEVIEDIKRGDKNWTDGNGEVLAVSARQISEKLGLSFIPTCIQVFIYLLYFMLISC